MAVNIIDIMVGLNELPCTFWPDACHAGDAVGGVALQRLDFDHFLRSDAVIFFDFRFVVKSDLRLTHFRGGEPHRDMRADELQAVAVAGGEHTFAAFVFACFRQRAENVVGLEALALHKAETEKL